MKNMFDTIIVGLGANGSAAAYHLSKAGQLVCGIDRFRPPHDRGSSHGQSRIIRQAYYENPLYVPFVREAYRIWEEVEQMSEKKLLLKTGGLMLGDDRSAVINGSLTSAREHSIPYQYLDNAEIRNRFPAFRPGGDTVGVLEEDAGILFPERCIDTFLSEAARRGTMLYFNEEVKAVRADRDGVEVVTANNKYRAGHLILSAGAWLNELLPDFQLPLTIERQVLYWFRNENDTVARDLLPDRMPVYIWEYSPGRMFYGFPDLGDGIKIAYHHSGRVIQPGELRNDVATEEIAGMAEIVARYLNMNARFNYSATCMYTNTPDENFVIDVHPKYPRIIIASPCSGHGFKFSSVTGKILADLAAGVPVPFDLSPFRIARFG